MPIDLLQGSEFPDTHIFRLYRHDLESSGWVLAYISVAVIEYEDCTIKISSPPDVDTWFRDNHPSANRRAHIRSKFLLHSDSTRLGHLSGG